MPKCFRLRIDNTKIYFEPYIMQHKGLDNYEFHIDHLMDESVNFDPSYINQSMMLWFSYNITKFERHQISLNETRIKIDGYVQIN